MLVCVINIFQVSLQFDEELELEKAYTNVTTDYQAFARFFEAQISPATEFDLIPTLGWLQPPGTPQYRIHRCKRANVMNCTRGKYRPVLPGGSFSSTLLKTVGITLGLLVAAGNPKLPKSFQGAYWQDGIRWDEVRTAKFSTRAYISKHLQRQRNCPCYSVGIPAKRALSSHACV